SCASSAVPPGAKSRNEPSSPKRRTMLPSPNWRAARMAPPARARPVLSTWPRRSARASDTRSKPPLLGLETRMGNGSAFISDPFHGLAGGCIRNPDVGFEVGHALAGALVADHRQDH